MLYRKVKNIDRELSCLGFGCMRFPKTADGAIDEPEATRMLHYAFDNGINYFDAAWPYHQGRCEDFVGRTLESVRDKITLVTKLPVWLVKQPSDMDAFLDKQLAALRTDHVDIYLLHALSAKRWNDMEQLGVLDFLEHAKASGKILHTGFSFHDGIGSFKKIIDDGLGMWDVCQIQYNLLDRSYQAGTEGLKYAAEKNIGVIVMEPLRGGIISDVALDNAALRDIAAEAGYTAPNFSDIALRWVWNQPEVSVVLSGMSTMEQLEQNLKSAENGRVGGLTPSEHKLASAIRDFLSSRMKVPCTACSYCMPCPQGIDIPSCFNAINKAALTGNWENEKEQYNYMFAPERGVSKASACVQCGVCRKKCPQHIDIPERLKEVVTAFEN